MTFVRPLAIHNIVIPGDGSLTSLGCPWVFAELYKQVWGPGGLSTVWTASLAEDIDALAVLSATKLSGGINYVAGDVLTIPGGTFTQAATIKVLTDIAGVIDTFEVWDAGYYTVAPTSPASPPTGGSGTGASFSFTTGTRPGSYSFMLSRDSAPNDPQFNLRNFGTKAAQDSSYAYIGINPDGALDPILSSSSPAGPANFSGTYGEKCWSSTSYRYYMVFEYDDAIMVCNRSDSGDLTVHAMHFGRIMVPRWSADIDGGGGVYDHRLDGLGAMGYVPDLSNAVGRWFYYGSSTKAAMIRAGLGNSLTGTQNPTVGGWLSLGFHGLKQYRASGPATNTGFRNFAGTGLNRFEAKLLDNTFDYGEMKYCKHMGSGSAAQVYSSGGADYFLCLNSHLDVFPGANGFIWMHTTASYDALVLGTYT